MNLPLLQRRLRVKASFNYFSFSSFFHQKFGGKKLSAGKKIEQNNQSDERRNLKSNWKTLSLAESNEHLYLFLIYPVSISSALSISLFFPEMFNHHFLATHFLYVHTCNIAGLQASSATKQSVIVFQT